MGLVNLEYMTRFIACMILVMSLSLRGESCPPLKGPSSETRSTIITRRKEKGQIKASQKGMTDRSQNYLLSQKAAFPCA